LELAKSEVYEAEKKVAGSVAGSGEAREAGGAGETVSEEGWEVVEVR
jgi:hypothetical protein